MQKLSQIGYQHISWLLPFDAHTFNKIKIVDFLGHFYMHILIDCQPVLFHNSVPFYDHNVNIPWQETCDSLKKLTNIFSIEINPTQKKAI